MLSPALHAVDPRIVEPAGKFLEDWLVDPANSAMAGMMSSAFGGDPECWKKGLEGFEGTCADYVKGLGEGVVDVVKGVVDGKITKVSVYGVEDARGEWTLYYNGTVAVGQGGVRAVTGELWPQPDLVPLQNPDAAPTG